MSRCLHLNTIVGILPLGTSILRSYVYFLEYAMIDVWLDSHDCESEHSAKANDHSWVDLHTLQINLL